MDEGTPRTHKKTKQSNEGEMGRTLLSRLGTTTTGDLDVPEGGWSILGAASRSEAKGMPRGSLLDRMTTGDNRKRKRGCR